jgi:alpha-L-rhamnosidase
MSTANNIDLFHSALPIWPADRTLEKNLVLGFRAVFNSDSPSPHSSTLVRLTASTLYRLWVNGAFAGYGPARAAHGFYRVDEWDITPHCSAGQNVVAIEVVGYNVNSYYVLNQPSFLQAEVVSNGEVLAATGNSADFRVRVLDERVQKVQRYSFQRPFVEDYRVAQGFDDWRRNAKTSFPEIEYSIVGTKTTLPRGVPYPRLDVSRQPLKLVRAV